MEEIEVRPLQVKDVFVVARMLGKITKGARLQLASALAGKKANPTEVGIVLFQSLVTEAEEDMKAWLADLAGKTKQVTVDDETVTVPDVAAFEVLPPTAILDVIEKLIGQEGIKDFFARASSLATKLTKKD